MTMSGLLIRQIQHRIVGIGSECARLYLCHDDATAAAHLKGIPMNVIPAQIQDLTKRVEKTPALVIALFSGLTALWSVYRLLWLVYAGFTLSSFGLSPISLIISFVVWTVVAVAAGLAAFAFWTRYSTADEQTEQPEQ
jgi:hypothetical protein